MPNHVETKMWLLSLDGTTLSDKQVDDFFSQFISIDKEALNCEEPRLFDFNSLLPQPDNIWLGEVGWDADDNIRVIEEYGGLDAVKQALKERKRFPIEKSPCLTEEQILKYGMVNGLDWNRQNWETKWGAYYCKFDFSARYGGEGYAQVAFYTAWNVPEKILKMVRDIAIRNGFEIECEFGGEIDEPGVYTNGTFMYWNAEWNEETEELERIGEPVDIHRL
jgi:hypothetical protein